jgi:putative flippase GtrA
MIDKAIRRYGGAEFADKHGQKVRFVLAGGLNTIVGLAAYPFLYYFLRPLGLGYLAVLAVSQVLCICFSYLTNKFLVFKTKGNYVREYCKFVLFHLTYFAVNVAVLGLLVEQFALSPVWSQLGFAGLVIITSYLWHSKITFAHRKS